MRCQQEVDETMDNEAGKSLAWVLSSYYEDDRLIFFLMMMRSVRVGVARRSTPLNLYQRHVKKAVASPNWAHLKHFLLPKVFQLAQSQHVSLHHRVSVRKCVWKEDLVITELEFVVKAEAVVGLPIVSQILVMWKTVNHLLLWIQVINLIVDAWSTIWVVWAALDPPWPRLLRKDGDLHSLNRTFAISLSILLTCSKRESFFVRLRRLNFTVGS